MKALLVLFFLGTSAYGQTATTAYRVKPKDTLDVIAAEYYGDRQFAAFIIAENKLKNGKVTPYSRLKIPVTRDIVTQKGESFESLAEQYLGDKRRAPLLADYNELAVTETPATGTQLTIPFQVTHIAEGNESLASIALRYLDDPKQADLIRRYNFLDKNSVEKGESVVVPMLAAKVGRGKSIGPDAEAKARRDEHRKMMAEVENVLPDAHAAWLQGDFAHVKALLSPFADKTELLDMKTAVDLGLLLGKAHVAFDETPAAVAAFKIVLERKSEHRLSSYAESPKVIDAWKQAGGTLSD